MRIFIITMEDPVYTLPFIKEIIKARKDDIVGVATAKGDRLKIGKKRSKYVYLLSLLLIVGIPYFIRYALTSIGFKLRKELSKFELVASPSILAFAEKEGIPTFALKSPNNKVFLDQLRDIRPDVIIHQSQNIVKNELLSIPTIGTLNRHNALLPKNRGRLTPFWVLYKGDAETGVSIHFVEEGLDAGPIVVQERFPITPKDTFNSIVRKNYEIVPGAMMKALDRLERGETDHLPNPDDEATYNTVPSLQDAWRFRLGKKYEE